MTQVPGLKIYKNMASGESGFLRIDSGCSAWFQTLYRKLKIGNMI